MTKCIIFDIDGTLADLTHRLHFIQGEKKDWEAFHQHVKDDKPIPHIITLARLLRYVDGRLLVFVTGRMEKSRWDTLVWLNMNVAKTHGDTLYMRANDDYRPDYVVKKELLDKLRADGFEPEMVFDDRSSVVKMWRAEGIPTLQVADGEF